MEVCADSQVLPGVTQGFLTSTENEVFSELCNESETILVQDHYENILHVWIMFMSRLTYVYW